MASKSVTVEVKATIEKTKFGVYALIKYGRKKYDKEIISHIISDLCPTEDQAIKSLQKKIEALNS